jgi:hypothetical protein
MEGLSDPLFVARPRVQVSFHRKGPWLLGVAHLQGPGAPIVLTARANVHDLEHAARALVMQRIQRAAAVGSLFGSIEHAFSSAAHQAEKVAKGKVARELFGQVRKVMKSPVASAALAATSIVFPPVGIPATAAFVTANKVLDNVEAGGAAAEKARKQIQALGKLARQPGPVGAKARKVARILSVTDQWRQGLKAAQAHASAPLAALADAQTRHVNGRVALPGGRFAQLHGVQRAGHIDATLTLPSGKRVPLRATVQGACGC